MPRTVIISTARTPFGKMGGGLAPVDATDLGGTVIAAALERADVSPDQVELVSFGQVIQSVPSGPDQGRDPEGGPFGDREQGLRVGDEGGRTGRPGDPRR